MPKGGHRPPGTSSGRWRGVGVLKDRVLVDAGQREFLKKGVKGKTGHPEPPLPLLLREGVAERTFC